MKLFSLALFLVIQTLYGFGQTANFSIFSTDKDLLGNLKVVSTKSDTATTISVTCLFTVKLLITIDVRYILTTVFKENQLYTGEIRTYRNNELHSAMNTDKVGNHYIFTKDGKQSVYANPILFSESMLYFNEPNDLASIYSEFDGVEKSIFEPSLGHYRIRNPLNGNFSDYFYESGLLKAAFVNLDMMMVYVEKN